MKKLTVSITFILIFAANIYSQENTQRYNPFSGTIVFSFDGGATLAGTDYSGLGVDYLGRASLEYFFPAWAQSGFGLRLFGSAGFILGNDPSIDPSTFHSKINTFGGGVVFTYSIREKIFPYLYAGISHLSFDPKGEDGMSLPNKIAGKYHGSETNYNMELGVRYPFTPNLSLDFNTGIQLSTNDWLDDKATGVGNDFFLTILGGISYSFLTKFDSDGDGVIDFKDACPNTQRGLKVDEFGCPIDSDHDGVADYLDECPDTPHNVHVDENGCPLDSDEDGVPDYTDICPETPKRIEVDALGCPYDLDADGVPDYLDKCPDTPSDVEIDKNGCPVDSDLDGVPDYLDQCPGTLPGLQVDENGCEINIEQQEEAFVEPNPNDKITLSASTYFDPDNTKLKSNEFPKLEKILAVMKKYPISRWSIEGYTDSSQTESGSLQFSKLRAESIANFFISHGVPAVRITTEGFGMTDPVADNQTPEGRTMNNRIVIIRLN